MTRPVGFLAWLSKRIGVGTVRDATKNPADATELLEDAWKAGYDAAIDETAIAVRGIAKRLQALPPAAKPRKGRNKP